MTTDKATPEDYEIVFSNISGERVLEDLIRIHGNAVFVKGGHEGDRMTAYNCGKREVLDFILRKISMAHPAPEPEGD